MFGRDAELAAVERFLAAVRAAFAALVLEGEPGIGKTTVWREAVRRAEERGFRVLTTRPAEAEARLSFAALADLLQGVEEPILGRLPAPQRQALEIALLRLDGKRTDRRAVFAASLSVLQKLAEEEPVIVAVDDVQWLDTPSAAALEFAVRRLSGERVGILGSVRLADEPAPATFVSALGEAQVERIRLGSLTLGALHHVLKEQLGSTWPRSTLVRIERASGGNPFFALEIARELEQYGPPAPGEPLPVRDDVRKLARSRVRRLPAATREALLAAAALSLPTVDLVDPAALAPAEDAGVVHVDSAGRVVFEHPLFASAIYGSAPAARKRAAHRRLAGLVEDPEQRARHLALASSGPDAEVAAALSDGAAHAAARGAPEAAAELEELAIRLTPEAAAEERLRRELTLAGHLRLAGNVGRARELIERTIDSAPPGELHAEALLLLSWLSWDEDKRASAALAEQAVAEAASPVQLGRAHRYAAQAAADIDLPRAAAHGQAAVELLEAASQAELHEALGIRAWHGLLLGNGADEGLVGRAVARGGHLSVLFLVARDELVPARAELEAYLEESRAIGDEDSLPQIWAMLAQVDCWLGRWTLAAEEAEKGLEAAEATGSTSRLAHSLFARALVDVHLGEVERARADCRDVLEIAASRRDPWFECAGASTLGLLELALGDAVAADGWLTRAAAAAAAIGMREPVRFRVQADHVEAAVALGDLDRAEELVRALEGRAQALPRPWTLAMSARCRGLLLAARGDLEAATAALGDALVHHERLAMPFELARTLLVDGQVRRRRREKRLAREAFERALSTFEELGAPLWAERGRAELARVRARRAPVELTATERQIAELAAAGRTNREIASALYISPKTVETRLASVYRKLGIRTRAELGARMAGAKT